MHSFILHVFFPLPLMEREGEGKGERTHSFGDPPCSLRVATRGNPAQGSTS